MKVLARPWESGKQGSLFLSRCPLSVGYRGLGKVGIFHLIIKEETEPKSTRAFPLLVIKNLCLIGRILVKFGASVRFNLLVTFSSLQDSWPRTL